MCHADLLAQLQTKESQLLASRSRIEDLRDDVRGAEDTAATIQAELDRSWKELAHLEGTHCAEHILPIPLRLTQ